MRNILKLLLVLAATSAYAQQVFPPSAGGGLSPNTFASSPTPTLGVTYLFSDASATGVCSGGGSAYAICVGNGSGWTATSASATGGTGNAAAKHTVTFSATPTFTCSSASAGTVDGFVLSSALSATITASTLSTCTTGEILLFSFTQAASGGPYTVAMPTGFDTCPINATASSVSNCAYFYDSTGPHGHIVGSNVLVATATTATTSTNIAGGAIGAVPYQSAANTTALLSGNTAATDQAVISTGTGSAAQAPTLKNAPALSAANMTNFPVAIPCTNVSVTTGVATYPSLTGCNTIAIVQPTTTITSIAATNGWTGSAPTGVLDGIYYFSYQAPASGGAATMTCPTVIGTANCPILPVENAAIVYWTMTWNGTAFLPVAGNTSGHGNATCTAAPGSAASITYGTGNAQPYFDSGDNCVISSSTNVGGSQVIYKGVKAGVDISNSAGQVTNGSHITNASIPNSGLVNAATTVNGQTCTLGSTCTATAAPSGSAGGDLGGTYPNPTVLNVSHVNAGVLPVANGGNGTATPALVAGTNVTLSGSWPAITINSTASAAGNPTITVANAAVTGTTTNTLTKLNGVTTSTAVIAATTDTGGVVGLCTSGCGTSSNATITWAGTVTCVFDGSTTINDYVQISSSTGGDCHDAGASYPTSGQVIGRVLGTNIGAGSYSMDLYPSEIQAGGSGGGANTTLSNLGTTNINAALLAQTGIDLGSAAKPFRNMYLFGSSTYGTDYIEFTGNPSTTRTQTLQDATDTFVYKATTDTLTNKRITQRVTTASDATSITPNTDNADVTYQSNSQAAGTLTINADTGTPTNGQKWILKINACNSSGGTQTYSWNAVYVGGNDVALPATTSCVTPGTNLIDQLGFIYDSVKSKWEIVAVARGY